MANLGLNPTEKWSYVITPHPAGSTSGTDEHYAIVFRTDHVKNLDNGITADDPDDVYLREPFYAGFRASNFDFTLIVFHASFSDVERRHRGLEQLRATFEYIQNDSACENDIILVGDFIQPADDEIWITFKGINSMEKSPIRNLIPASTLTSLGDTSLSMAYDNIWMEEVFTGTGHEFSGSAGADYYFQKFQGGQSEQIAAANQISDHVPVFAQFRTDLPDDDTCPK